MGFGIIIDPAGTVENIINLDEADPQIDGEKCVYLPDRGMIDIGWKFTPPSSFTPTE